LTFSNAIPLPITNGGTPTLAAAGDFNGDGHPDLAVVDNQGIQIYLNTGDGSFKVGSTVLLPTGLTSASVTDLIAVDTGTGHVNLVLFDSADQQVDIILGNGDGTFGGTDTYPVGDISGVTTGVVNTGNLMVLPGSPPDLAVGGVSDPTTHQHPSQLVVLHNNGHGTFSIGKFISLSTSDPNSGVYTSTNLATTGTSGQTVLIGLDAPNDHNGQPYISTLAGITPDINLVHADIELNAPGGGTHYQIVSAVTGDFNGDGIGDFAAVLSPISGGGTSYLSVLMGTGGGNFQTPMVTALPSISTSPVLVAGDFRGLGYDDLVIGNEMFQNNGAGTFADAGAIAKLQKGFNYTVAKFDGDALPDFVGIGSAGNASIGISEFLSTAGKTATTTSLRDSTGSKKTANPGVAVTFIATVSGDTAGGGDVAFYAQDVTKNTNTLVGIATLLSNGFASIVTKVLNDANGNYQIQAAFLGTSTFGASASSAYTFKTFKGGGNGKSSGFSGPPGVLTAAFSGKLPTNIVSGLKNNIRAGVALTATGGYVSGSDTVAIYLAAGTTVDANAVKLLSSTKKLNLKAGAKSIVPFTIATVPTSVAAGKYYLVAQVTDPNGRVFDVASPTQLTIAPGQIDLSGTFAKQPIVKGAKATLTINVSNAGNIPASGPLVIDIDTSPDGLLADATVATSVTRKISIKPNAHSSIALSATLPAGTYFVAINLDPNNAFNDTNRANDFFASASKVTVS